MHFFRFLTVKDEIIYNCFHNSTSCKNILSQTSIFVYLFASVTRYNQEVYHETKITILMFVIKHSAPAGQIK